MKFHVTFKIISEHESGFRAVELSMCGSVVSALQKFGILEQSNFFFSKMLTPRVEVLSL